MKKVFVSTGVVACVIGLIWIGQGTGYFPYPERSFMISQTPWASRGAGLMVFGAALVWFGRRSHGGTLFGE